MLHHKCIHGVGMLSMRWANKSKIALGTHQHSNDTI